MTVEQLKSRTRNDLAGIARKYAVPGWHAMRKDELIKALLKVLPGTSRSPAMKSGRGANSSRRPRTNGSNVHRKQNGNGHAVSSNHRTTVRPSFVRTFRNQKSRVLKATADQALRADTLVAEPHDSHWIHAQWSLSQHTLERAEAALGIQWRQAVPILRVLDVTAGENDVIVANWVRDVEIHGEVSNWYVPVEEAPRSYRLEIGYLAPSGHFFLLARSNVARTPRPGTLAHRNGAASNGHSQDHGSRQNGNRRKNAIVQNRIAKSRNSSNGNSARLHSGETEWHGEFPFEVHTELVVHGTTHPHAKMTLLGEEVQLEADGSFSLRIALPDGRQVIPAVAVTPNGAEQRTIVLGVERNTRELEPQNLHEPQY